MNRTRTWILGLALILAMGSSSCRIFHRPAKAAAPQPPKPAPQPSIYTVPPPQPKPEMAATPPDLPPSAPDLTQLPAETPEIPPPPKKRVARRRPEPDVKPAEPEPDLPVPELEQILTPQQQQEYNQSIDFSIKRAQRNIASLNGRRLNQGQIVSLERIKTFINQALNARNSDLLRAKNLAERADVLAEDLLRSVQ